MSDRGAFTITDAAEWLDVSESHVERLIADGVIESVKLGGRRLIARSVLERLVDPITVDLKSIETADVARVIRALGLDIAVGDHDADEQRAIALVREKFAQRLAYAEGLAVPMNEQQRAIA